MANDFRLIGLLQRAMRETHLEIRAGGAAYRVPWLSSKARRDLVLGIAEHLEPDVVVLGPRLRRLRRWWYNLRGSR